MHELKKFVTLNTFSQGIPTKAKVYRDAFQGFIDHSALRSNKENILFQNISQERNRNDYYFQRLGKYPRWQPYKNEETVATRICGNERLHEGFPISLPFSKRTKGHMRNHPSGQYQEKEQQAMYRLQILNNNHFGSQ